VGPDGIQAKATIVAALIVACVGEVPALQNESAGFPDEAGLLGVH
jgi:hypothetical protein